MDHVRKSTVKMLAIFICLALSGCGILPKIDTSPENQTQEVYSSEPVDFTLETKTSDPAEEEEELDPFEQQYRNELEVQQTLKRFFDEAYEQYLKLESIDLSDVLDMSSEECKLLTEELQQEVEKRREAVNTGEAKAPEKLPYEMTVVNSFVGGSRSEGNIYGAYTIILKPSSENGVFIDENYLNQYPPFLRFGVNSFFLEKKKTDDGWTDMKIISFYQPEVYLGFASNDYKQVVQSFYDTAWKQYLSQEYTGLKDVMNVNSRDYQEVEELLKTCIEERKSLPGQNNPEIPGYRIRFIDVAVNPPGAGYETVGTVRFELEPILDSAADEPVEEQLKQYPSFMKFGEHCWSIHPIAGETIMTREVERYSWKYVIESIHADTVSNAAVKSFVRDEMLTAVGTFFDRAYDQYLLMGDVDLSEVLDMSSAECIRAVQDLKDAINRLKAEKGEELTPEPDTKSFMPWLLPGRNPGSPHMTQFLYNSAGTAVSTDDTRDCRGYCIFEIRLSSREEWEEYYQKIKELTEEDAREIPKPKPFSDEENEACLKQFLPCLSTVNAFSFNWDDGTCKIDGFDAWEMFEGE